MQTGCIEDNELLKVMDPMGHMSGSSRVKRWLWNKVVVVLLTLWIRLGEPDPET